MGVAQIRARVCTTRKVVVDVSDELLIAVVSDVKETRKGPKIWLQVLRGSLADGDVVEVVHADGTAEQRAIVDVGKHPITPESFAGIMAGGGAGPFKQLGAPDSTFRQGDLIRTPGGPPVEIDPQSELAVEIRSARRAGRLHAYQHLDNATIGLHIQWLMGQALKDSKGLTTASGSYLALAKILAAYGLQDQSDRANLVASAILEGYQPSASVKGLASLGAGVLNAFSFPAPMLVGALGMAMEEGDAFAASFRRSVAVQGAAVRTEIMDAGRAVAVGWCKKCGDVVPLDAKFKCATCRKQSDSYRVVVNADRDLAEIELRAEGPPKRGIFGF